MKRSIMTALAALALILTACGDSSESGGSKPEQTVRQVGSSKAESMSTADTVQSESSVIENSSVQTDQTSSPAESISAEAASSKILVAYFTPAENGENDAITSASKVTFWGEDMGNAEAMANVIAAYTKADLFSIQTVKDYPLEYNDLADNAKAEQDKGELPELATSVDISGYDTVFVVYPVWWYTMPQPIYTFFNDYDLSGKTLIPVTTHEGSGLADSVSRFKELEPNAAVKDGYSVRGGKVGESQGDIENWLKEQGY